jgi:Ca2+-binding EF-hand superfamily protein
MHMKMMSDRVMTRDEVVQHVRKLFARLDVNKDGFLTKDELEAMHNKMMGVHGAMEGRPGEHGFQHPDRAAMFDRLDTNHDGSISRQEFMAAQPQLERRVMIFRNGPDGGPGAQQGHSGEPGMKMRMHGMGGFGAHLFEMADANHDSRVSLQEAEAAALAHFDRADLNHDGKITPDERRQAHQLMREHRPS